MLALIPVLINTNGDNSFVWFLRLSVCFRMLFLPGLKAGGSLVRVGSELWDGGVWNTLPPVLPAVRRTQELLQALQEQLM